MIKLELEITEVDYNALIDRFLPDMAEKLRTSGNPLGSLLSGPLGRSVLDRMPISAKDKLTAELINGSAPKLRARLEDFAAQNGAPLRIGSLRAEAGKEGEA